MSLKGMVLTCRNIKSWSVFFLNMGGFLRGVDALRPGSHAPAEDRGFEPCVLTGRFLRQASPLCSPALLVPGGPLGPPGAPCSPRSLFHHLHVSPCCGAKRGPAPRPTLGRVNPSASVCTRPRGNTHSSGVGPPARGACPRADFLLCFFLMTFFFSLQLPLLREYNT